MYIVDGRHGAVELSRDSIRAPLEEEVLYYAAANIVREVLMPHTADPNEPPVKSRYRRRPGFGFASLDLSKVDFGMELIFSILVR